MRDRLGTGLPGRLGRFVAGSFLGRVPLQDVDELVHGDGGGRFGRLAPDPLLQVVGELDDGVLDGLWRTETPAQGGLGGVSPIGQQPLSGWLPESIASPPPGLAGSEPAKPTYLDMAP